MILIFLSISGSRKDGHKKIHSKDEAKKEKETINKMPSLYNSISKFASRLILLLRRNFELK
jgi:hypothetical protein